MMATDQLDLPVLNPLLEKSGAERIVRWAAGEFGEQLVMSSSFGAESAVLIHMATRVLPRIRIIFIDTAYLFPETFAFMEELRKRFDLNVWTYRTRNDPMEYLKRAGEGNSSFRQDIESCCAANKNEPFERAIRDLQPSAWLRGIRRAQAATRRDVETAEWSARYRCYAISPLANWTGREMRQYMVEHGLPYHPLYEKGYLSVGCNPTSCTRPVQIGGDDRSGRWSATEKLECGINQVDSLDSARL